MTIDADDCSSRFAGPSLYLGIRTLVMLLYITLTVWIPHLIYFWITVIGLCVAPFLFNPHQFSFADFIIDYREFLRWMSRGNSRTHANSWVGYCRLSRTRITGFKRKRLGLPSEKLSSDVPRAPLKAIIIGEIISPICLAIIFVVCYLFVKSFPVNGVTQPGLLRIAIIALGPIVWNMALLVLLFLVSVFLGPCVSASHRCNVEMPNGRWEEQADRNYRSTRRLMPLVVPWLPWPTLALSSVCSRSLNSW